MSWLDFLRGRKSSSLDGTLAIFRELYGTQASAFGQSVNTETAMQVSAVFACARVIGQGMAQVPLKLMRAAGDKREPATEHPLYRVLGSRPNPWQTSYEFRETLSWHVELCGNFFAYKGMIGDEIRELIPFEPGCVTVTRENDYSLTYKARWANGQERPIPASLMWHVRGPSWNTWFALEVLKVARAAIGLSMGMEKSQGSTFSEGINTSGVYSVEGTLNSTQKQELSDWIARNYTGSKNAGKPMILDKAAKWTQTQMTAVDAQLLESRREQIAEVCRFMGVMPIMAGFSDKAATYASAEQMFLAHLVHCLAPRWTRYEQSMDEFLLTDRERKEGLYFDFVEEGMIRGSVKDTKDALLGYVNGGLMTPNEAREKLDLNPDSDPASGKLRLPVNVAQQPPKDPGADPLPA